MTRTQEKKPGAGLVAAIIGAAYFGGLLLGLYWLVRFVHWAWVG